MQAGPVFFCYQHLGHVSLDCMADGVNLLMAYLFGYVATFVIRVFSVSGLLNDEASVVLAGYSFRSVYV